MNEIKESKDVLKSKVGKLLMVGFDGFEPGDHLKRMMREYHVGGVILFRRNVAGAEQVKQLTGEIRRIAEESGYSYPPLITLDQEGGMVNRITDGVVLSPGNMAFGATRDENRAREAGYLVGRELKSLGINVNLAPVLDIVKDPENHLGTRCFGEDPELVGKMGREFSRGLAESGVAPVGKHFLGYGGSVTDPHEKLPINPLPRKELLPAMEPFKIAKGSLGGVMSAHIVLKEIDSYPATLSRKILTGMLREEIGFSGPVITDCLEMGAIQDEFGTKDASVRSISAGADMLIVSHLEKEQVVAINSLKKAIETKNIPAVRVSESIQTIERLSRKLQRNNKSAYDLGKDFEKMTEIAEKSITAVRKRGFPLGEDEQTMLLSPELSGLSLSRVQDEENETLSLRKILVNHGFPTEERTYDQDSEVKSLVSAASEMDKVIMLALAPSDFVKSFLRRISRYDTKVVLAGVDRPWGFTSLPAEGLLLTYSYRPASLEALGRVLSGKVKPEGESPVSL